MDEGALMARRTFEMVDLRELYVHWYAGRSQVQLAESLGIDRKTVRKYLAPAIADGIEPGGQAVTDAQWSARNLGWFPQVGEPGARALTWPEIEGHRARIKTWLEQDVTVSTIAQRLRDEDQLVASESSVRRWVTMQFGEEVARAKVTPPSRQRQPEPVELHPRPTT